MSSEPVTQHAKRLALYGFATAFIAGLLSVSDSVRPPYVGWTTEVLAAVAVLAALRIAIWWPFETVLGREADS